MLPREEILKQTENREEIAKVLDKAQQAIKSWEVCCTDFLAPPIIAEIQQLFSRLTEIEFCVFGGYPQAERQRVGLSRSEIPLDPSQLEVALLDISGNFLFDPATHRDFLGAILGTGIVRDKVGDIIVLGERGAQVLVVPEIVTFLEQSLVQVRSVPVKTQQVGLENLKFQPPSKKEITTVEASLRLDAIASAGLGMSRSKMVEAINGGNVRVNWKEVKQSSYQVKSGDLIAVSGKGRVEVGEIVITKKERYRVQMIRFK